MIRRRLLVAAVVAAAVPGPAGASGPRVRWFTSPSGNIQCEVASADPRGTYAYCQTFSPPQTATLKRDGRTAVCTRSCSLGNGPVGERPLPYGQSTRTGIFRCTSSIAGMRCLVAGSGRGFSIAREGIRTF